MFLIASRIFCDNEHVKPVPSGSTNTFSTLLLLITKANRDERTLPRAAVKSFSRPRA